MFNLLHSSQRIIERGNSPARIGLLLVLMCLTIILVSCNSQQSKSKNTPAGQPPSRVKSHPVIAILNKQVAAWNEGDIERFMQYYWKSDDLTFSSGGKTTRGWDQTLAGYRRRYPTAEKMGRTRFDNLEVYTIGEEAVLVLGQWHLERKTEPMGGNFSLVFKKIDGRWLIIHDHTSRAPDDDTTN